MEFKYSLENFRGIAILFIMLAHVQSLFKIQGTEEYLRYFFIGATVWFAFITGYLFHYLESHKFRYTAYLKKKIKFVLGPYLFLSIFCVAIGIYFHRHEYLHMSLGKYIAWSLSVGGSVVGPMWFIPMVTLFFLITPFLHKLAQTRLVHIVTLVAVTFSIFSGKPSLNLNPILSLSHYLGFYLLGISCAKETKLIDRFIANPAPAISLIIAGLSVFILSYGWYEGYESLQQGYFDKLGKVNAVILGKVGLLVASYVAFNRYMNYKNSILSFFAKMSFGLFFIHGFYMVAFEIVGNRLDFEAPLAMIPIEIIFVIGLSVLTVLIVKALLGSRSRYVIGY